MNINSVEEKTPDSSQRSADGSPNLNSPNSNSEVQRRLDGQDERLLVVNQAIIDLKTNVDSFQSSIQSSIGELADLFKTQFKPALKTPQRQSFAALSSSEEDEGRSQDGDGSSDAAVNRWEQDQHHQRIWHLYWERHRPKA